MLSFVVVIDKVITDPNFEIQVFNSMCLRTEDGAINQFNGRAVITFDSTHFVTERYIKMFEVASTKIHDPTTETYLRC